MDNTEYLFYKQVLLAIIKNELHVHFVYQLHAKSYNGNTKITKSAESLTRFGKFHGKDVLPYLFFNFLPQAAQELEKELGIENIEKNFLFLQLDNLVNEVEENIDALGKDFIVSFNVSPHLFNEEFKIKYCEILKNHPKVKNKNISIELTEVSAYPVDENQIKERKNFLNNMHELQQSGTIFALDDFNTDFSDERALLTFPFDVVKIDHSKFQAIAEQITNPNFAKHFEEIESSANKKNVLDTLYETLKIMKAHKITLPKKIICEGLKENSCSKNPSQNIPLLIDHYYGQKFREFGYDVNNFLYQGYEINAPFKIDKLVNTVNSNQPDTKTLA